MVILNNRVLSNESPRNESNERSEEYFLHGIVSFVGVVEEGERQLVHILLVGLYQAFNSQRISAPAFCKPLSVHDGHSTGLDASREENLHFDPHPSPKYPTNLSRNLGEVPKAEGVNSRLYFRTHNL